MKTWDFFYRKRGLPQSIEQHGVVEADNFYDANSKASKTIGEDHVVLRVVRRREDENESTRLSKEY